MGSRIASVGVAWQRLPKASSIDLQVKAAQECLEGSGVHPREVGILINAGVYREGNIVEPAIASFIQRRIGANVELDGTPGTFSFDLSNGGCGMLTGMMVADGFIRSGLTRHGLVLGGDAEPGVGGTDGFEYAPAASAVLLSAGGEDDGLVAFRTDDDTRLLDSYRGRVEWVAHRRPHVQLLMHVADTYVDECLEAAVRALDAFLDESGLAAADVDLLVPSQSPPGFVAGLSERTGLGDRVVDVTGEYGNVHTAGVGMALGSLVRDGRLGAARTVVLLSVGAGIATSLALYRVPR